MNPLSRSLTAPLLLAGIVALAVPARAAKVTILEGEKIFTTEAARIDGENLWLSAADFKGATGFEIKPEGACLDDICVPLPTGPEADLVRASGDETEINLTAFAARIKQPVAADAETATWSFAMNPLLRGRTLKAGIAPDFELPTVDGETVRLSDYKGKKVLIVTWASWCGCQFDLPGWQKLYEELRPKNFEIISVAEDTGGVEAAGPAFRRSKTTFPSLIDEKHTVSTLFELVNVPMGIWIDEEGRIVRPPEVAYVGDMKLGPVQVEGGAYVDAVRDWVEKGAESEYVLSQAEIRSRVASRDKTDRFEDQADAYFKLAAHFQDTGDTARAARYFDKAQELNPDSWNYHRQDWAFLKFNDAMKNWNAKVRNTVRDGGLYYAPNELSNPNAAANAQTGFEGVKPGSEE